ncbi:hypothetical protein ABIB80_007555 [Bradyrhizobium sp. i1.15.2]
MTKMHRFGILNKAESRLLRAFKAELSSGPPNSESSFSTASAMASSSPGVPLREAVPPWAGLALSANTTNRHINPF